MSGRSASWLAWFACALSLALTALSLSLLSLTLLHSDTPVYFYWLETSMVAFGYSTVGAIVASRLPDSPIGWLFCAIGLSFGVVHFSAEYAAYALACTVPISPWRCGIRLAKFLGVGWRTRPRCVLGSAVSQRQTAQ